MFLISADFDDIFWNDSRGAEHQDLASKPQKKTQFSNRCVVTIVNYIEKLTFVNEKKMFDRIWTGQTFINFNQNGDCMPFYSLAGLDWGNP